MLDLRSLIHGTAWLAEPGYMRRAIAKLQSFASCPTARDLVGMRRERLANALTPQTHLAIGVDLPEKHMESKPIRAVKGKVGIIGVYGPIQQRLTGEMMKFGGTSTEEISDSLQVLLEDKSVGAIVLDIDSPGGSSYGTEELSDKIFNSRGSKPIYAIANSMACSAAYWIASAADQVFCTPSGDVGSVGVYCIHVDESKALEMEGIKVTLVSAGKYKVEANSLEPLGEEARAMLQDSVNETYAHFVDGLKRNRNTTKADIERNFGQGRVLSASQALEAGVIDRIITLDELLNRLMGRGSGSDNKQASTDVLRKRMAQQRRQEQLAGAYR